MSRQTEAQAVYNMAIKEGWKIVKEQIEKQINSDLKSLVVAEANDPAEVASLQGRIRARREILSFVKARVQKIQ